MALVWSVNVPPKSFTPIINPNYTISRKIFIDQKTRRYLPQFSLNLRSVPSLRNSFRSSISVATFYGLAKVFHYGVIVPDLLHFAAPKLDHLVNELGKESEQNSSQENGNEDLGVKVALSMLRFYKREISPLLPKSCRYVPTCSEYSMIAYKKYGVVKGSILTAWRICRCNPLGGSGFDPPRWFDEPSPPEE